MTAVELWDSDRAVSPSNTGLMPLVGVVAFSSKSVAVISERAWIPFIIMKIPRPIRMVPKPAETAVAYIAKFDILTLPSEA